MSKNRTVDVTILEKEYTIACPEEAEASLLHAAKLLDKKMREIKISGKVFAMEKIAVMAALNIIYELQQKNTSSGPSQQVLSELHGKLDRALRDPLM